MSRAASDGRLERLFERVLEQAPERLEPLLARHGVEAEEGGVGEVDEGDRGECEEDDEDDQFAERVAALGAGRVEDFWSGFFVEVDIAPRVTLPSSWDHGGARDSQRRAARSMVDVAAPSDDGEIGIASGYAAQSKTYKPGRTGALVTPSPHRPSGYGHVRVFGLSRTATTGPELSQSHSGVFAGRQCSAG